MRPIIFLAVESDSSLAGSHLAKGVREQPLVLRKRARIMPVVTDDLCVTAVPLSGHFSHVAIRRDKRPDS